jgi:hypothetical protein
MLDLSQASGMDRHLGVAEPSLEKTRLGQLLDKGDKEPI